MTRIPTTTEKGSNDQGQAQEDSPTGGGPLVDSDWTQTPPVAGECLKAVFRLGDSSLSSGGATEISVTGATGHFVWEKFPDPPNKWRTDEESFVLSALPGGGPGNYAVTLGGTTVPGGATTYGKILGVHVEAVANGTNPRWVVELTEVVASFFDPDGIGWASNPPTFKIATTDPTKGVSRRWKVSPPADLDARRVVVEGKMKVTALEGAALNRPAGSDAMAYIYVYTDSCF